MLDGDEAGCAGPGDNPSATFGPSMIFGASIIFGASMTFGLERGSEGSFDSRGGPLAIAVCPAPPGAFAKTAGGLTLASKRRGGAGRAIGDGGGGCKPIFVGIG